MAAVQVNLSAPVTAAFSSLPVGQTLLHNGVFHIKLGTTYNDGTAVVVGSWLIVPISGAVQVQPVESKLDPV